MIRRGLLSTILLLGLMWAAPGGDARAERLLKRILEAPLKRGWDHSMIASVMPKRVEDGKRRVAFWHFTQAASDGQRFKKAAEKDKDILAFCGLGTAAATACNRALAETKPGDPKAAKSTYAQTFKRERFVWEHNKIGKSTKVIPPFTPLAVKGQTVSAVLRKHRMNALGLWDQVSSEGVDLLGAPMRLEATAGGKVLAWKPGTVEIVTDRCLRCKGIGIVRMKHRNRSGVLGLFGGGGE